MAPQYRFMPVALTPDLLEHFYDKRPGKNTNQLFKRQTEPQATASIASTVAHHSPPTLQGTTMAPDESHESGAPPKDASSSESANADVSAAVEELLNSLSNKFAGISSELFAKMDEMSRRLDNLETALQQSKAPNHKEGGSSSTP
ncbi:hypothetical protein XA68_15179 [Ophiocordyceps unilateralis]|uniref:Uncharacterized protein n=1 Tax=Ophiocordyceps unilateralis TaxID=268505 RepID=A0A2A9PL46_OPHUN|nr:hypothetical protein XA68_15179 [Ophiocordyceps unilateralis]